MSVEKCRASASRAWLENLSAAFFSARERERSTTIERITTTNAQGLIAKWNVFVEEQPLRRFMDDPNAGDKQQQGLEEGREVLDLSVAVGVLAVGGPAGDAHGPERHGGGQQVEPRMQGLGENAQAVGREPDAELRAGQQEGRRQRRHGDPAFFPVGAGERFLDLRVGHGLAVIAIAKVSRQIMTD